MSDENKDVLILLFVKSPAVGDVKTRLSAEIGSERAAEIYKCFVFDLLSSLQNLEMPFQICFYPSDQFQYLKGWLGSKYNYLPQKGSDLGQRMKNAFINSFENDFKSVVIIGSDSPDLPPDFLHEACDALKSYDVVIGPAEDGGYYLIGFNKDAFYPNAFDTIQWSSDSVFEWTIEVLKQQQLNLYLLPPWYDIDTLEDLKTLVQRNEKTDFRKSKTFTRLTADKSWSKTNV